MLLVEQRPAVVDKATIRRRLWQDTFVSDANLPTLIAEIRSAIGDDAKQPRFVRTVHGIGYSFDAQAEAVTTGPRPAEMPAAWLVGATLRLALGRGETPLWSSAGVERPAPKRIFTSDQPPALPTVRV